MRLLVSVRSADEVEAALAGGADIIDAKDPERGALGAVEPVTLHDIAEQVACELPLSVALGDCTTAAHVEAQVRRLSLPKRLGATYLKLGFAGLMADRELPGLVGAAVGFSADVGKRASIVAVAYADWPALGAPPPGAVLRAALLAGAHGVLLDTSTKDGRTLFEWMTPTEVVGFLTQVRAGGLVSAVAGSLDAAGFSLLAGSLPDVVGVRGAACSGGRLGRVSAERVGLLRDAVDHLSSRSDETPAKRDREVAFRAS
jgi:(5-formylfuran-3-yl)methyl phosphate synthase